MDWSAAAVVAYPYVIYPALLWLRSRLFPRPVRYGEACQGLPSVSVLIAAYNEHGSVGRRVREFAHRIASNGLDGEVVVVSDGSTDGTAEAARHAAAELAAGGISVPVRVIALRRNVGKSAALAAGSHAAKGDVLVLADARQTWAPDALTRLLENFHDPEVGAVSGELEIESVPGVMSGVGLYWRLEKWMRRQEGLAHSTVGLTGAICAVRRELFHPPPPGTILDDVYWPLLVVMNGRRVVFDSRARAYDRLPDRVGDEFRRKVRTLSGNFQLVARLPAALLPGSNPVWFALWSHKLSRLAVPWALPAALFASASLGGPLYGGLFAAQLLGTAFGLAGLWPRVGERSRLAAAGASFLTLNAAAWLAFWVWATGRTSRCWNKTDYTPHTVTAAEPSAVSTPIFEGVVP
ncbi:MAG: glycosyltransferase [Isosphaeraceae bacterium]